MGHQESIETTSIFEIKEGVSYEQIDDCFFILNTNDGEYYELNSSSSLIWKQLIEGKNNLKVILEGVNENHIVTDEISTQVSSMLNELKLLGLIREMKIEKN